MKITSYSVLKEDSSAQDRYTVQSHLHDLSQNGKNLSKLTGISLKQDGDAGQDQNENYEYNINNLKFRFHSDYNDVTTTRAEHAYAFYDNTLHIVSNRRRGDNLTVVIDGKPISELRTGVKYDIKSLEGQFQSVTDKEDFQYFELLDPPVIRLSKKLTNPNKDQNSEKQGVQKVFNFKPNTTADLTLFQGKNKIDIKGDVRIESLSKNGYKYKISTPSALYTLTLDKPFTSGKGITYNAKLVTKTDGSGTQTMNDLQFKNNTDIKYR